MTSIKRQKIDFGSFQRSAGTKRRRHAEYYKLFSAEPKFVRAHKQISRWGRWAVARTTRFAVGAMIIVLLLQGLSYLAAARNATGEILGAATDAYTDLNSAGSNLSHQDFSAALTLFASASGHVADAQQKLDQFKVLTYLTPQANSAHHILVGAGFLADAGTRLTSAFNLFDNLQVASGGIEVADFNQKIADNRKLLADARALLTKSVDEFDAARSVPADYTDALDAAKTELTQLQGIIDSLVKIEDLYTSLFAGQKVYLLVFQNYDEARATGGFLGTYGVLKTNEGSIQSLQIESIYNLDGQIHDQIAAPGPMQPAIKKWGIRDANWFVDFPQSASKLLDFFEKGKETADGVLALTPKTFVDLLQITGPIDMPAYGVTLTAENFQDMVQFKTSVDYDKVLNQPKKFLDDFAPVFLDRLSSLQKEDWLKVLAILSDNLASRQIMMYAANPDTQAQIATLGFSGAVQQTDYDYLSINNSNLGGTKTDLSMQQQAQLDSKILSDGSIIDTLQITRANTDTEHNRDYLRVLVPSGSTFISATGFDQYDYYPSAAAGFATDPDLAAWDQGSLHANVLVHEEAGKAEFSGWVDTPAGGSRTLTLTYILPFKVSIGTLGDVHPYSLLVQKQSGSIPYQLTAALDLNGLGLRWATAGVTSSPGRAVMQSNTNTDDFWAMLLSK
jgi:hypothetical protein